MKLCLDLQGAQTESRFRGIGRYSLGFARALAARASAHDVTIVLNGAFGPTIESLRAAFSDIVPPSSIAVFDIPGPIAASEFGNTRRRQIAEPLREAFLAGLAPDIVHVSSMVEGWVDDGITSVGAFDEPVPTAATLYDLIPLMRPDDYLVDARYREFYTRKIADLKRSQLLFAISENARREAIAVAGFAEDRVVSIGCGIDPVFTAMPQDADAELLRQQCGVTQSYVLYAGGFDARKNVSRLIEAYGRLPRYLRQRHLMVIAGRISGAEQDTLLATARKCGVPFHALKFTGEVSDAVLAALYRHAALFVFPSLHEGFGLPVAEAMVSGTPVLASNASNMPEVIGRAEALFDPLVVDDMASRIEHALIDEGFRRELSRHGIERGKQFSWEACAARALPLLEAMHLRSHGTRQSRHSASKGRPRLAYVSPLPPLRTGIADYSAGLLPELSNHYDIDLVVDQESVSADCNPTALPVRSIDWFEQHAQEFERVLYHVGNSPFHRRIIATALKYPGTVVMHDVYLTGIMRWIEEQGGDATALRRALYDAHGYKALVDLKLGGREAACLRYPASLEIIEAAGGVIMHSRHAVRLVQHWYGSRVAQEIATVPLYAPARPAGVRATLRARLDIPEDAFVVCSFGFLAPTKLNHRLIAAWKESGLVNDPTAWLVFAGENEGGEYGRRLLQAAGSAGGMNRIRITGYTSEQVHADYLAAADIAVQLRTMSRGETSWALLRCLANGLPTIVNTHGAVTELPDDVVFRLADEFTDGELSAALLELRGDGVKRRQLAEAAALLTERTHTARAVAAKYRDAIEHFAQVNWRIREQHLIRTIAGLSLNEVSDHDVARMAEAIARQRPANGPRQLLVDVSVVAQGDLRSGIERVVRGVLMALLRNPPEHYRVEPIRDNGDGRYVYARQYTLRSLELPESLLPVDPVEVRRGDMFLGLDWFADGVPRVADQLVDWRIHGVEIHFVVYDLLPVLMAEAFPPSSLPMVTTWLDTILRMADGLVCISRSVAEEVEAWIAASPPKRASGLKIGYFRLGSSLAETLPTRGIAGDARHILQSATSNPAFLMVGTVEPRKAHHDVLAAFEVMWRSGHQVNLVIAGRQGWMMEAVATLLRSHPELGRRLFWFADASDELLEQLYSTSVALIAASRGEGFGLPIVEAARHGLPVIARDIPVFREVAGDHAYYFADGSPDDLARTILAWVELRRNDNVPDSGHIEVLDWEQSTASLCRVLFDGHWHSQWSPLANPAPVEDPASADPTDFRNEGNAAANPANESKVLTLAPTTLATSSPLGPVTARSGARAQRKHQ